MSLLQLLRDTLAPASRRSKPHEAPPPDGDAYQPADLPPFTLHVADQMRFDPQVRIGLGARNGLLMSAEMEVVGPDRQVVRWVERQWQRIWSSAAHQLLRTKLYGFMPFEVFYRRTRGGEFDGAIEFDRLKDHEPRHARLLVDGDQPVGFVIRDQQREERYLAPRALLTTFDAVSANH
jgi:hypothetical protein